MRRALRLTGGTAAYFLLADGAVVPPFGILGGHSAAPIDSFVLREGQEIRFAQPGKVGGFALRQDDVLVLQSACGGGYGDPLERPIERIAEEFLQAGSYRREIIGGTGLRHVFSSVALVELLAAGILGAAGGKLPLKARPRGQG
jgi:N-methylhydantoinase B/oxoprolinase/acetone carboxylase alpha subunit